ncbi:TPA: hypothetical protein L6B08_23780 [Pseudomonas aeruginosa]|nr:hypothetical protein B7D75_23635 [Pseudomonas paraeruginosa]KAB0744431.1 hypothetical protein F7O94_18005 [Pseudomonas aeruginosa]MCO3056581.1 hypothetical protein [Pseudomonas aeruginosa]MCO3130620.1 hypothetical protein [Pseudomonas aeruginosa]MCO3158699.1 hypothetical protein [Pseudomonas aeruginosa]
MRCAERRARTRGQGTPGNAPIELDDNDGGGQILRSALSLSMSSGWGSVTGTTATPTGNATASAEPRCDNRPQERFRRA